MVKERGFRILYLLIAILGIFVSLHINFWLAYITGIAALSVYLREMRSIEKLK